MRLAFAPLVLVALAVVPGCGGDSDSGNAGGGSSEGGSPGHHTTSSDSTSSSHSTASHDPAGTGGAPGTSSSGGGGAPDTSSSSAGTGGDPHTNPDDGPAAGNPDGHCDVPAEAKAEDASNPTTVVGTGTAASCTSDGFVNAVAKGGVITFDCGPDPVTITLDRTAKVFNDKPDPVIDGGGKVTLSGGGHVRILYQDTCDQAQVWTTSHCQDQETPKLTVQNLTFVDGNATGQTEEGGGGGAILVRGGRLKIVNSRFFHGACEPTGPDLGGAAVRVLSQSMNKPVFVVNSTFGGAAGYGGACSNGGGLSSIGVSYTVINSLFAFNDAIGNGANPAQSGTPGGGSGGAIYNDGNTYTLSLCGVKMTNNHANEGGGAIFFVSNDGTGNMVIKDSVLTDNPSDGFENMPGIFYLSDVPADTSGSTIQ